MKAFDWLNLWIIMLWRRRWYGTAGRMRSSRGRRAHSTCFPYERLLHDIDKHTQRTSHAVRSDDVLQCCRRASEIYHWSLLGSIWLYQGNDWMQYILFLSNYIGASYSVAFSVDGKTVKFSVDGPDFDCDGKKLSVYRRPVESQRRRLSRTQGDYGKEVR